MESIKQINIKKQTYYRSDVIINIKLFDSNLLKIDKKSYKNWVYHNERFCLFKCS